MPHLPPRPSARPRYGCALAVLILAAGLLAPAVAAGGATDPGAKLDALQTAWEASSPDALAACMEEKGMATFNLIAYPLSGRARSMKPDQAKATLKEYFKKIAGVKLVDVTPERSPKNVRLFDYTYKPAGENERTTRLHVQLKQDPQRLWVLASVTESPKPRS